LEKSEELQTQLEEQKEDSKNSFIQAKQNYEDKGFAQFYQVFTKLYSCLMLMEVA